MNTGPNLIRILTVDDHPMLREGIASLVASQSDMELVAEASTGREALEQFRNHRPDLTLMDLQMPDMDGIEAMVAIRDEFPEARIIVLTTYKGDVQTEFYVLLSRKPWRAGLFVKRPFAEGAS